MMNRYIRNIQSKEEKRNFQNQRNEEQEG